MSRTNEAILAAHAAFQGQDQQIAAQCLKSGQGWAHSTSSGVKKSPKDFPTPPAITACLSMRAAGLVPNTVHRGRVLRGTVASQELLVTNNITLLLRDERGGPCFATARCQACDGISSVAVQQVSLNKQVPGGSWLQQRAAATRMFPPGRRLALLEPLYAGMLDRSQGVSVDSPAEVVFPASPFQQRHRARLKRLRGLPAPVKAALELLPAATHPMDVMRTGCSVLGTVLPEKDDHNVTGARDIADRLMASFGSMLLYWYHFSHNGKRVETQTDDESIAGHFLHLLHGKKPSDLHAHALDKSLVLYAEHEFNASTFAARVIAGTGSDIYSALTGAIGALRGPKHGGANEVAMEIISRYRNANEAEADIRARVERKEIVIGFGHPVYTVSDPRNEIIKEVSRKLCNEGGNATLFEVSERIEKGQAARQNQNLTDGTTHVAVGFLDLGGLCASLRAWEKERFAAESTAPKTPSCGMRNHQPGTLRWIGFDKSLYTVVKTSIIAQMLKMGADTDVIVQVWYSAAWSAATLKAFRAAVTIMVAESACDANCGCPSCRGGGGSGSRQRREPSPFQALMQHWLAADVPLAVAREKWMDSIACRNHFWIGNFTRKMDRMALGSYLLTGQLGDASVGSVVMFALPHGAGERAQNEHFLTTIPFVELTESMNNHKSLDTVEVGMKMLRKGISRLRTLVMRERISLQVMIGNVQPDSETELGFMASIQPRSISWANIPSDLPETKFHTMARQCSSSDTVHTFHNTRWEQDMKGACFVDFKMVDRKNATKFLADALKSTRGTVLPRAYKAFKWDKFLMCPPVDSAANLLNFALYGQNHEKWVEKYFKNAVHQFEKQVKITHCPLYSVMPHSLATINVLFTYSTTLIMQTPEEAAMDAAGM
ncbi:MAG: hypothetical protein WDW38_004127 [Sanguina aurantia]